MSGIRLLTAEELSTVEVTHPKYTEGLPCEDCADMRVALAFRCESAEWRYTCTSCYPGLQGQIKAQFVQPPGYEEVACGWEVDWRAEPVFNVYIAGPKYPYYGLTFADVQMDLFKDGYVLELMKRMGVEEIEDELYPDGLLRAMSWAEHCFTETEVQLIKAAPSKPHSPPS